MRFEWVYMNGMAATLMPPDNVSVPTPRLDVSEPGVVGSEVQMFEKPWPSLEPCATSAQAQPFPEGLFPDFDTEVLPSTFVASLAFLPPSTGPQTTSVRADLPDNIEECFD